MTSGADVDKAAWLFSSYVACFQFHFGSIQLQCSLAKFSDLVHSDPQLSLKGKSRETEKEMSAEAVTVFAPVTAEKDCGTPVSFYWRPFI